ncbi:MAG TPA: 4-alpha-glucanotransferase, partial [Phycisphaerales bacterium]|nr:4-alpha-glucanotransferase [Phycisphaerales bacterium]
PPPGGGWGGGVARAVFVRLPRDLPFGYHRLVVDAPGERHETLLIRAPRRAFAHEPGVCDREWGLFCPLYALRSGASRHPGGAGGPNLGCGDFTDLRELAEWSASLGGRVLATLPLLASFNGERPGPFDPSPYAPVSRRFWNELFIDPALAPGFDQCDEAKRLLQSDDLRREAAALRAIDAVDYRRAATLKRRVLEALSAHFFASGGEGGEDYRAFLRERPDAAHYAAFRAATEKHAESWDKWPARQRKGALKPGDFDPPVQQFHLYAQYAADRQIAGLAREVRGRGGLVYLDLPVGVSPYGFDVWSDQSLFAMGCSTGAPPDPYFTGGQNWGFAPMRPDACRAEGYRSFIASLRHHMKQSDYLRLDHVMAFHRLFWIPDGRGASEGVYVHYEAEEFYAILCLESHRHRCRLVGENLGTVPPAVNKALNAHDLCGLFVGQYECQPSAARALRPVPTNCVASVNTHDMPPFAKSWEGSDIDDRIALRMLDPARRAPEHEHRRKVNAALAAFLRKKGLLAPGATGAAPLRDALHAYLGRSSADFLLLNIEDLWLESRWQNIPGTLEEHANWRHKLRLTLDELRADARIAGQLRAVDHARRGNGKEPGALRAGSKKSSRQRPTAR